MKYTVVELPPSCCSNLSNKSQTKKKQKENMKIRTTYTEMQNGEQEKALTSHLAQTWMAKKVFRGNLFVRFEYVYSKSAQAHSKWKWSERQTKKKKKKKVKKNSLTKKIIITWEKSQNFDREIYFRNIADSCELIASDEPHGLCVRADEDDAYASGYNSVNEFSWFV